MSDNNLQEQYALIEEENKENKKKTIKEIKYHLASQQE